jgi:hypothetical protein
LKCGEKKATNFLSYGTLAQGKERVIVIPE